MKNLQVKKLKVKGDWKKNSNSLKRKRVTKKKNLWLRLQDLEEPISLGKKLFGYRHTHDGIGM
jgi:hypothetical protein